MKLQWIVVFVNPAGALPVRMGRITHTKMRRILDGLHADPRDTDKIMDKGHYDPLWNVEFYREDKAHLITTRPEEEEFEYVNSTTY
jgi:hypothetical protein